MKLLRILAGILVAVMAPVIGVQRIHQAAVGGLHGFTDWLVLGKGVVLVLAGPLAAVGLVLCFMVWRSDRQKAAHGHANPDRCGSVDMHSVDIKEWIKAREKERAKEDAERAQWTPEHPKPQTFDWDDGTCPYKRDGSKPLGSKENPVVAGVPSASDHLVFSGERGCWILTDGLGNGWIR